MKPWTDWRCFTLRFSVRGRRPDCFTSLIAWCANSARRARPGGAPRNLCTQQPTRRDVGAGRLGPFKLPHDPDFRGRQRDTHCRAAFQAFCSATKNNSTNYKRGAGTGVGGRRDVSGGIPCGRHHAHCSVRRQADSSAPDRPTSRAEITD